MAMFNSYVCLPEGTQFWKIKVASGLAAPKFTTHHFAYFCRVTDPNRMFWKTPEQVTGWWYTYPSEKYEFVRWDDDIPNWTEIHKNHVPSHQPDISLTIINHY